MQSAQSSHPAFGDIRWLQAFAATLARDGDEADDLVQETLIEAWRQAPEDRPRGIRPWLAGVLRNRSRMTKRSTARREKREANAPVASPPVDQESVQLRLQVLETLVGALSKLPTDERTLVVRRFFDDESPAEIAASLNIPAATVRSKLHRSLKKLRLTLDETHGDRAAWALVVGGVPLGTAPRPPPEASSNMSIPLKIAAITIAASTVGVGGYVATRPTSEGLPSIDASEPQASQPERAPESKPSSARERWAQRRLAIRDELDGKASPSTLDAAAPAKDTETPKSVSAFRQAINACAEDAGIEGALTVSGHQIGAPDIGTIYDSVAIVDTNIDDPDLKACIVESMYDYVGPAPEAAFEKDTQVTGTIGEIEARSSETLVRAIAGAHHGEVRFCAGKAAQAQGKLVFNVHFTNEGEFEAADVGSSDVPKELEDCVKAAVNRWKFPPSQDTDVTLPFEFPMPTSED